MGWAAGSAVMVTSTAFNGTMEEAETVIVTAVSADGLTITLAEPGLLYRHLGETRTVAGGRGCAGSARGERGGQAPPPHLVLSGHAASLISY